MTFRNLIPAFPILLIACAGEPSAPSEPASGSRAFSPTAAAAPVPATSCTVRPVGTQYEVSVTWSRVAVRRIVLYDPRLGGGGSHAITLSHPQRKGSLVVRLEFQPFTAGFGDRDAYQETACEFISS